MHYLQYCMFPKHSQQMEYNCISFSFSFQDMRFWILIFHIAPLMCTRGCHMTNDKEPTPCRLTSWTKEDLFSDGFSPTDTVRCCCRMWPNRKCKEGNPAALQQGRKREKGRMLWKRERPRLKLHVLMDTPVYPESRENDKNSGETRLREKV